MTFAPATASSRHMRPNIADDFLDFASGVSSDVRFLISDLNARLSIKKITSYCYSVNNYYLCVANGKSFQQTNITKNHFKTL